MFELYDNHNDYRDYLSHHGILGQRWGKRNGPPYPLGVGDHSASEKRAGWQRSLTGNKDYARRNPSHKKDLIRDTERLVDLERLTNQTLRDREKILTDTEQRIHDEKISAKDAKKLREEASAAADEADRNAMAYEYELVEEFYKYLDKYGDTDIDSVSSKKIDEGRAECDRLLDESGELNKKYKELSSINDSRIKKEETIEKLMTTARDEDRYDLEFMERIQNADDLLKDTPDAKVKVLKEYEKYLNDPMNYRYDEKNNSSVRSNDEDTEQPHFGIQGMHWSNPQTREKAKRIREKVNEAKKTDKFDMWFLEKVQNKEYANNNDKKSRRQLLEEYEEYLWDPENYKPSGKDM